MLATPTTIEARAAPVPARPETFRLPKPGIGDAFFGMSRSFYYEGEKRGYWKLIRVCDAGKTRGVTLVPYAAVAAFVAAAGKKMEAKASTG
jgi:hypothetical protein